MLAMQEVLVTKESCERTARAILCKTPEKKPYIPTPPDPMHDAITRVLTMRDSVMPSYTPCPKQP
jgi:hypothetical protein